MTTRQPEWQCVAQMGDASPIEHGGLWVFIDTTGVYPPEAERYDPEDGRAHRFILEPCTYEDGVLSDNPYHKDYPVWFADDMQSMAATLGMHEDDLLEMFLSDDVEQRAFAWAEVGCYFGMENLDAYPLELTEDEAAERYEDDYYVPDDTQLGGE